jgi:hypothetical protein
MESPVCTPMGSKFSMLQITTQLSLTSRMTSSSNSFHPAIDFSTRISPIGDGRCPRRPGAEALVSCGDARAGAAEDETRADHDGPADSGRSQRLVDRVANPDSGTARPMSAMAALKSSRSSAVSMASGRAPMTSTPKRSVTPRRTSSIVRLSAVWPPERGQQRVGPFALHDVDEDVGVERLDVGDVGRGGVGHDRGRIGVDQDDLVPLGAQHLTGLGTRVVELTGLADDDRARADHHDRVRSSRRGI